MKLDLHCPNEVCSLNLCESNILLLKFKDVRTEWTIRKSRKIKQSLNNQLFYLAMLYYCSALIATTPVLANTVKKNFVKVVDINKVSNNSYNNENITNHYQNANNTINSINRNSVEKNFDSIAKRRILEAVNIPDDDEYDENEINDEFPVINRSAKGTHVGASCDESCSIDLHHVFCDRISKTCICHRNHPVLLSIFKGCAKPKQLGEQCFYHQTCQYSDENSLCVQVSHNAMCQCSPGYHSVTYMKPTKRVFCTEDLAAITSDLPTLLGVTTGIAVLAGLICMVLHLFSKTKYPHHRNFADANIPPPIMYSSDTVQSGRPSSRSSLHSTGSNGSYGNRRPSSAPQPGSKGVLVSTSRTGSRRPSVASVHSTSSSVRSYGVMRFEKEAQQKEIRNEMKLRLTRLQQQHFPHNRPHIVIGETVSHITTSKIATPTPSPLTPNSLDELLPPLDILSSGANDSKQCAAYRGPCSSSSEGIQIN